jgi:hypothetical protein
MNLPPEVNKSSSWALLDQESDIASSAILYYGVDFGSDFAKEY